MDKILVIVSSISNSGGVSTVTKNICRALYDKNIKCDFICYDEPNENDLNELKVMNSNVFVIDRFISQGPFKYIKKIRKIIRENQPYKAVHVHTSLLIGFACYAASKENIKVRIGHAHGAKFTRYPEILINILKKPLAYINRKYCTHMIACSDISGKFTFERNFDFFSNFIDINNCINQNIDRIKELKLLLNIPHDAIVVGNAGRVGGLKNPKFLLEVFEELHKQNSNMYLLFIGDGEEIDELKHIAEKKGISEFIKFSGHIDNVANIISIFDVYVNTSISEGMSISILEAQAASIPCVVSNGVPIMNDAQLELFQKCNSFNIIEWKNKIEKSLEKKVTLSNDEIKSKFIKNKMDKDSAIKKLKEIIYS